MKLFLSQFQVFINTKHLFSQKTVTHNMNDNWHQSSASLWNECTDNSNALHNLGPATYNVSNAYSTNFNRNIFPLSYYFSSAPQPYLLKGDPNLLLQQFSEAYNYLKTRHILRNCCLQICVRSQNSFQTWFVLPSIHVASLMMSNCANSRFFL